MSECNYEWDGGTSKEGCIWCAAGGSCEERRWCDWCGMPSLDPVCPSCQYAEELLEDEVDNG